MTRRLVVSPEAEADIEEAAQWYLERSRELSSAFSEMVERAVSSVADHPFRYRKIQEEVRRAPLDRFPYQIAYEVFDDEVVIWACTHVRRDPEHWQSRRRR